MAQSGVHLGLAVILHYPTMTLQEALIPHREARADQ